MEKLLMVPGPTNVPARIMDAMKKPMINHRSQEFHELYERIVENLKYPFQTKNDVYVLSSSGTGGIECAVFNSISPNDKVIVPVNGFFSQRLAEKVKIVGGELIEIPIELGKAVTAQKIKEVLEKEKDVKAICIVSNETSTGVKVQDLCEIGKIADEHNALLIADAISMLGGDELPVDEWKIDICVAGSQKCLACPPGLAMISVSEKAWDVIRKVRRQTFYFDLLKFKNFYDEKRETPFTPSIPLFYALDEGLKIIKEEGLENRIERHKTCAKAFYAAIESIGLSLFANPEFRSNTVIAVKNPDGISDKDIRKIIGDEHNIIIGGGMGALKGKMFRIGNMGIISKQEVLATIDALEKTLLKLGYKLEIGTGIEAAEKIFS